MPGLGDLTQAQSELRTLVHRLSDQLGIILAEAEVLEADAIDASTRARASHVVASAVDAVGTIREIRSLTVTLDL